MNIKLIFFIVVISGLSNNLFGQTVSLTSRDLEAYHVKLEETVYKDKKAIRVTGTAEGEQLAFVKNPEFSNGTIEVELAGQPLPGTNASFRGFIGIAFRIQQDDSLRYECFYLRPTNGRAEDQLRRNHSVQYISHPRYPWAKLRKEFPGVYESYADMAAGEWTSVKIIVTNDDARLYINGAAQPCLIVTDMKGNQASGLIGLWIGPGTDGYFRNLKVTRT